MAATRRSLLLAAVALASWAAQAADSLDEARQALRRGDFPALIRHVAPQTETAAPLLRAQALALRAAGHAGLGMRGPARQDAEAVLTIPTAPAEARARARLVLADLGGSADETAEALDALERETAGLAELSLEALLRRADALERRGDAAQAADLLAARAAAGNIAPDQHARLLLHLAAAGSPLRLDEALVAAENAPASWALVQSLLQASLRLGPPAPAAAIRLADLAGRHAKALGDSRSMAFAALAEGRAQAAAGHSTAASTATRRALFLAQAATAHDGIFAAGWHLARLQRHGNPAGSLPAYRLALRALEDLRGDLLAEAHDRGTEAPLRATFFQEFADTLLLAAKAKPDAPRQALLREARDVVEQLRSTELEDYFQDDCVARRRQAKQSVESFSANTAVLYPLAFADRLELLASIGGRFELATIPADRQRLTAAAVDFRRKLEKKSTHEYRGQARQLYDWLLRPLEAHLATAGIDTLIYVPDGPLRGIPLGALHDGRGFLVERFAVATVPALDLVASGGFRGEQASLLIGGLSDAVAGFPALPHVTGEIDSILSSYAGTRLENAGFSVAGFGQEIRRRPYSAVHIASHGQFSGDPRSSFLLAYDGKITMDGLEDMVRGGQQRTEPIELLTLSACQSAAGDERAALGLAGVALKAGVASAVASLWFVNDQAASFLLTEFYLGLRAGQGKAQALRSAQRRLLADGRYRHPGYWAPFLMIGNWL